MKIFEERCTFPYHYFKNYFSPLKMIKKLLVHCFCFNYGRMEDVDPSNYLEGRSRSLQITTVSISQSGGATR